MDARPRNPFRFAFIVVLVLWVAPFDSFASDSIEMLPLVVRDGRCECVLPTPRHDDKFFLIVGSLNPTAAQHRVTVRTLATRDEVNLPLWKPPVDAVWDQRIRDLRGRLAHAQIQPVQASYEPIDPPRWRTFFVFTGDQDFNDSDSYTSVKAELRAVGKHCQVYLDKAHPEPRRMQPTMDDIVRTFDCDVFPKAGETFGRITDVDRDGRFTILLSGCLDRLQNGKTSLGGFVRGSDFYRDLRAPFGNRCDMMYLNTDLEPGPHLRSLLAHEFTHAVIFSEHVFGDYLPEVPRQDEESWLNEGLAHLAEDLHGYGWSNLDYRISAFLNAPERYPLVMADFYRSGVWRNPGVRGGCYLFVRWCVDHDKPDLPGRLTRTNLTGVANLEAATGEHFADLFREWTASLLLSGTGLLRDTALSPLKRIDTRRTLGDCLLCGPRFEELPLIQGERGVDLHGTSAAYFLLHSAREKRIRLEVTGPVAADLQITLVRLPAGMGRLSVRCDSTGDVVRLTVKAHDASLKLTSAAWERLTPSGPREPATIVPARDWFPQTELKADEEIQSGSLKVDMSEPVVFKISGIDGSGRRVAAWIVATRTRP